MADDDLGTYKGFDIYFDLGEISFHVYADNPDDDEQWLNLGSISVPEGISADKFLPVARMWIDIVRKEYGIF